MKDILEEIAKRTEERIEEQKKKLSLEEIKEKALQAMKEAVQEVRPYAIDVSSSLETEGKKDKEKIREFMERIRYYE